MLSLIAKNVLMAYLACAGTVSGSTIRTRSPYAVKDSHHVPRKWSRVGAAPPDHLINLQIGLKQGSFSELERHLYEGMSIPTSR